VPLGAAITGVESLKDRPVVAQLLAWNAAAIQDAKFDRDELTLTLDRAYIRQACAWLQQHSELKFNFLSDLTCVDRYPQEPRFEVIYHLLSMARKERVRLKVRLNGTF